MSRTPNASEENVDPLEKEGTQCLLVLQLLRDDRGPRWTRPELGRELYDVDPIVIGVALDRLRVQGVVCMGEEWLWASPSARHLDALGFISI